MTIRLPRRWTPAGAPTERGFSSAPDFAPRRRTSGFPSGDIVRTLSERRLPALPTENSPPVITAIPDRVEYPTIPIRDIAVTVTDPDPDDTVTVDVAGLPPGLSYAAGKISGTISGAQPPGPVLVSVFASDGRTTTVLRFTITVAGFRNLDGPVIYPVLNRSVERGDSVVIPIRFVGAATSNPEIAVSGLPAGLRYVAVRGEISGTISATAAQSAHTVVVSLDDGEHDAVEIQFIILVRSGVVAANPPPLIGSVGSFRYRRGETISTITISVEENDSGTITITGLPAGLSAVTTSATATITGTISASAALGRSLVTITADDGVNPRSSLQFLITVHAPAAVPLPPVSIRLPVLPALPVLELLYSVDRGSGGFRALRRDVELGAGMTPPEGWNAGFIGHGGGPVGRGNQPSADRPLVNIGADLYVLSPAPAAAADAVIRRVNSRWNLIPPEAGLFWMVGQFSRDRQDAADFDLVRVFSAQRYVTDRWKAANPAPPATRTTIFSLGIVSMAVNRLYGAADATNTTAQLVARIRPSPESYNTGLTVRMYGLPDGLYWTIIHGGSNPDHGIYLSGWMPRATAKRNWNIVLSVTDGTQETRQSLTLRVVDAP